MSYFLNVEEKDYLRLYSVCCEYFEKVMVGEVGGHLNILV